MDLCTRYATSTIVRDDDFIDGPSGTRESWINIPCGIEITTKNVNLCATVRDSLGGVGEEFIAKTTAMCSCIPKALNYVSQGLLGQVAKNVDVSASTVSLLSEYMELQQVGSHAPSRAAAADPGTVLREQCLHDPGQQGRTSPHGKPCAINWMDRDPGCRGRFWTLHSLGLGLKLG